MVRSHFASSPSNAAGKQQRGGEAVQFLLAASLLFVVWSVLVAQARVALTPYDGATINGLFQLIAPIRRTLDGYALGADFVVFHGPLWHVPYLPIYILADGNAAVLASFVVAANFGFLVLGIALVHRSLLGAGWFIATSVAVAFVVFVGMAFDWTGISNIGQRSAVPLALIGLAVMQMQRSGSRSRQVFVPLISGAVLGLAIDTGLQALAAMAVAAYVLETLRQKSLLFRMTTIFYVCVMPIFWLWTIVFLTLSRFSADSATRALAFSLRDTPSDQRWFFGTWPQAELPSLLQILQLLPLSLLVVLATGLLGMSAFLSWTYNPPSMTGSPGRFGVLSLTLLPVFGLIPIVGGIAALHYAQPGIAAFAVLLGLLAAGNRRNHIAKRSVRTGVAISASTIAVAAVIMSLLPVVSRASANLESFAPRLLPPAATVAEITAECETYGPQAGIWSQYPNVLHVLSGCSNAGGDLLIHNVGTRRSDALEQVQDARPLYVETLRSDVHLWEAWLQSTHATGYVYLWENYYPTQILAESVLWRRRDTPIDLAIASTDYVVPAGSRVISINSPQADFSKDYIGIATVRYRVRQPFRMLPVVGSLNHFGLLLLGSPHPNEFVSLNPMQRSQTFFVYSQCDAAPLDLIAERRGQKSLDSIVIYDVSIEWVRHPSASDSEPMWRHIFGNPGHHECSRSVENEQ